MVSVANTQCGDKYQDIEETQKAAKKPHKLGRVGHICTKLNIRQWTDARTSMFTTLVQ